MAQVPASVDFQEKWRQALALLRRARSAGFHVTAVLADAEFGDISMFRRLLHQQHLPYALGVSRHLTVQTQYAYEPFGNLQVSGATTANALAFTGREADGTGLYFYRARYYSPHFQRFISSDPLGFAGGDLNTYANVGNSPAVFSDPFGLDRGMPGYGMAGGAGPLANRPGIPPNHGPGLGNGTAPPPPPPCGGSGTPGNGWFGFAGESLGGDAETLILVGSDSQKGAFYGSLWEIGSGGVAIGFESLRIIPTWSEENQVVGIVGGEAPVPVIRSLGGGWFTSWNGSMGFYLNFGLFGWGWHGGCTQ